MSTCPTAAAHRGQNNHIRRIKCQLLRRGRNHFYSLCFTHPHEEKHQMLSGGMSQEMWETFRQRFPVEP